MGGIESIWIIFVIWAIVSAVISKNKEKAKRAAQANQPPRPVNPTPYSPSIPQPAPIKTIETIETVQSQQELKRRLQAKKQAAKRNVPETIYMEGDSRYPQSSLFTQQEIFPEAKSNISLNITKPEQFNQEALFNAIIMSEILGKPKALRRR